MTVGAYDEEIAMALELITEFGQQCQWTKEVVTPADPDRPWRGGTPTPTDYEPYIAFIPASDASSGFGVTKLRQGEDVPKFTTIGLMAPQAFTPEITDVVVRGGVRLTIATIDTLRPAEEPVLHILGIV